MSSSVLMWICLHFNKTVALFPFPPPATIVRFASFLKSLSAAHWRERALTLKCISQKDDISVSKQRCFFNTTSSGLFLFFFLSSQQTVRETAHSFFSPYYHSSIWASIVRHWDSFRHMKNSNFCILAKTECVAIAVITRESAFRRRSAKDQMLFQSLCIEKGNP